MPGPKLTAIITALLLMGSHQVVQAGYSLSQLQKIDRYMSNKDCAGLWTYLARNPAIMKGNDPLSRELRKFMSGISNGLIECASVVPQSSAPGPGPLKVQPDVRSIY